MKTFLPLLILLLTTLGCSNKQTLNEEKLTITETELNSEKLINHIANYPEIKDTTQFINDLQQLIDLEVNGNSSLKNKQEISVFNKVKIYGSEKDYYFIEYDRKNGSMLEFPWKNQFLVSTEGELVKVLSAYRFEFVTIFENQNPFLLTVERTAKGNGGHGIYKISTDTLENVYEGYYNYEYKTYDKHEDIDVYEPNELKIQFTDNNNDGFNDITFSGNKLMLGTYTKDGFWYDVLIVNGEEIHYTPENPASEIPLEYIFLYDKQSGHFKAKEDYNVE